MSTPTLKRWGAAVGMTAAILAATISLTGAAPSPAPTVGVGGSTDQTSALAALGITVGDDGWINYKSALDPSATLSKATTSTVQGTLLKDGSCLIQGSVQTTGSAEVYSEEVAYNPETCAEKILSGVLPAGQDPLPGSEDPDGVVLGDAVSSRVPAAAQVKSGTVSAAATSYASAHTKTSWIDPINLTITSNTVNLKWPLYGAGGTLTSSSPTYVFPWDNWQTVSLSNTGFKTLSDNSGWYVQQNVHFVNHDFADFVYANFGPLGWLACGSLSTDQADFYHQDRITGYRSGSTGNTWSDNVSGACSNLVHHASYTGSGFVS